MIPLHAYLKSLINYLMGMIILPFTVTSFSCSLVTRCRPLPAPQHSVTSLASGQGNCDSSVVYGSVCNISCEEGYTVTSVSQNQVVSSVCSKIVSSSTIGYWDGPSVDCIRKFHFSLTFKLVYTKSLNFVKNS